MNKKHNPAHRKPRNKDPRGPGNAPRTERSAKPPSRPPPIPKPAQRKD